MQLTRVNGGASGTVGAATGPGGDADLLALLLGGENAGATPAFPTALEEAIAEGVTGQAAGDAASDDAVTDALAVLVGGDGTDEEGDAGAATIDAALAAALALGGASVPAVDTVMVAEGTQSPVATDAITAETGSDAAIVATPAAPGVSEVATPTQDGESAATAVPVVETDAAKPADDAAAQAASASGAAAPTVSTGETADTKRAAVPVRSADRAGDATRHADAGGDRAVPVADGDQKIVFSAGGAREHGFDLSSKDDDGGSVASLPQIGKPGHVHTATGERVAVATAEHGAAGVARHEAPVDARATGIETTPPPSSSAPTHETGIGKAERGGQHFGAIEPRWSERVADAVRLSALRGGGDIRLQLEPEGLGHIDVRLQLHQDGVRAVIVAEHESTRQLLTNQQHLLQDAFARSDLRLSDFSVDVGSGGHAAFARGDGDGQPQGGRSTGADAATTVTTAGAHEIADVSAATIGNGRVSVRV